MHPPSLYYRSKDFVKKKVSNNRGCSCYQQQTKTSKESQQLSYHISLNKRPGIYFLRDLQYPAYKRDRRLFKAHRISYRLFRWYGGPTMFFNCGAPTWTFECLLQETCNHGSDGLHLRLREHFLTRSVRLAFLHLTPQTTIAR